MIYYFLLGAMNIWGQTVENPNSRCTWPSHGSDIEPCRPSLMSSKWKSFQCLNCVWNPTTPIHGQHSDLVQYKLYHDYHLLKDIFKLILLIMFLHLCVDMPVCMGEQCGGQKTDNLLKLTLSFNHMIPKDWIQFARPGCKPLFLLSSGWPKK